MKLPSWVTDPKMIGLAADASREGAGIVGAVCLVHGVDLINHAAGWIAGGAMLVAIAYLLGRRAT